MGSYISTALPTSLDIIMTEVWFSNAGKYAVPILLRKGKSRILILTPPSKVIFGQWAWSPFSLHCHSSHPPLVSHHLSHLSSSLYNHYHSQHIASYFVTPQSLPYINSSPLLPHHHSHPVISYIPSTIVSRSLVYHHLTYPDLSRHLFNPVTSLIPTPLLSRHHPPINTKSALPLSSSPLYPIAISWLPPILLH